MAPMLKMGTDSTITVLPPKVSLDDCELVYNDICCIDSVKLIVQNSGLRAFDDSNVTVYRIFSSGLAAVKLNDMWRYINTDKSSHKNEYAYTR